MNRVFQTDGETATDTRCCSPERQKHVLFLCYCRRLKRVVFCNSQWTCYLCIAGSSMRVQLSRRLDTFRNEPSRTTNDCCPSLIELVSLGLIILGRGGEEAEETSKKMSLLSGGLRSVRTNTRAMSAPHTICTLALRSKPHDRHEHVH